MPTLGKTKVSPSLISTGSTFQGTSSYAITASYAMNGGSGGSGGAVQTGSIANQTVLYNVTTSQDNVISGLNLSSNKWGVTVVEEWNSGSIVGDEYYSSCSLLMHFSGSNGSTTFIDNSPNNLSITSNNGAKITSSISKFGGTSGFFDGTNDYLSIASNSVFDLTGNYTIEFWAYSSNFGAGGYLHRGFYSTTSQTWTGLSFSIRGIGAIRFYFYATNNTNEQYVDVSAPSSNTWHHFAMVKSGTTGTVYIDGTLAGTVNSLNTPAVSSQTLRIGVWDYSASSEYFNGYIDEIRITKGIARYTGNFTVPTSAFLDNSGSTQIETKYIGLVGGLNDSTVDYGVEKLSDSSLKIRKMTASGLPLSGSGTLSASVDRVYVNVIDYTNVMVTSSYALTASYVLGGIQTGSISNQTILYNVTTSQENTITGLDLSGNKWDVSVIEEWNSASVVGDQYYNSCSLLLHFSGSNGSTVFIDNSLNNFAITSSNGTAISTVQSKFGGSSGYFDGTDDYINIPDNSVFDFGSGDFTIEYWEYRTSSDNNRTVLSRKNVTYTPYMMGYAYSGNVSFYASDNGSSWTIVDLSMGSLVLNTWTHYAVTRQGNTFRTFKNGTLISSTTSTMTFPAGSAPVEIGKWSVYYFQGYIDELRITKGIARYTGSFATQSAEFYNNSSVDQLQTKYIGLVGGLNDTNVDYGVEKLSDSSLKIRKMTVSGTPVSGSPTLSASVDRVYVNVINYKNVQTTVESASYASTSSYVINAPSGESFHPFLLG